MLMTTKDNRAASQDCAVFIGTDGKLEKEIYRTPTRTDQYLFCLTHITHYNTN